VTESASVIENLTARKFEVRVLLRTKLKKIVLAGFFALVLTQSAIAGFFGPNTYEECVADFVKSSKQIDNNLAQSLCRSQFPKLTKLSNKKDAKLACEDVLGKWVYTIEVKTGKVYMPEMPKVKFLTTSSTKEGITFKGESEDVSDKRKVTLYGKVDAVTSVGRFAVEYADKKTADVIYDFTCVESN